jgi:mannose-6-phosphate isomerase-like protein (cupin superfamily)
MAAEPIVVRADDPSPFDFGGLEIRDYTAGRDVRTSWARIDVPAGAGHPEAWSRRSDKLYYVLDGFVRFRIDGRSYELSAGDLCVIPQGSRFAYENPLTEAAALLLAHTPPYRADHEVLVDPFDEEHGSDDQDTAGSAPS